MTSSNRRLTFTHRAESDLREILQYSLDMWGAERRDAYAKTLANAIDRIATFPMLGQARHELGSDVRSIAAGMHQFFYRVTDAEIVVIRIAHNRQDQLDIDRDMSAQ